MSEQSNLEAIPPNCIQSVSRFLTHESAPISWPKIISVTEFAFFPHSFKTWTSNHLNFRTRILSTSNLLPWTQASDFSDFGLGTRSVSRILSSRFRGCLRFLKLRPWIPGSVLVARNEKNLLPRAVACPNSLKTCFLNKKVAFCFSFSRCLVTRLLSSRNELKFRRLDIFKIWPHPLVLVVLRSRRLYL